MTYVVGCVVVVDVNVMKKKCECYYDVEFDAWIMGIFAKCPIHSHMKIKDEML